MNNSKDNVLVMHFYLDEGKQKIEYEIYKLNNFFRHVKLQEGSYKLHGLKNFFFNNDLSEEIKNLRKIYINVYGSKDAYKKEDINYNKLSSYVNNQLNKFFESHYKDIIIKEWN